ncbi:MAG: membrane dipeptidase [Calditrichia bacterium]
MQSSDEQIIRLHNQAPFTDIHVHPSLKAFLFRRNLWRHYRSGHSLNPFSSRSDFKVLQKGRVGVIWASHYFPEKQLLEQCFLLKSAAWLLTPVYYKISRTPPLQGILGIMQRFEREVSWHPEKAEIAYSAADVKRIRSESKIAVVHTIEGGHVLEGNPENIDLLAQKGVALLTLCHFFNNGLAANVVGIPPDMLISRLCPFRYGAGAEPPLSETGREVIRRMKKAGMLPDITHCTPEARQQIYQEINRETPLIATHIGVQNLTPDAYNLADEEIREIAASGGIVGVIFTGSPGAGTISCWAAILTDLRFPRNRCRMPPGCRKLPACCWNAAARRKV